MVLKELHAMAQFPDPEGDSANGPNSLLVELKAIPLTDPHYPFYGKLKLQPDRQSAADRRLHELLASNGAVVETSFLSRTQLQVGDPFTLGKIQSRIMGVIDSEPDRISRAFSLGPRVFVSLKALDEADLVQPGSRIKNRTLIRLPEGALLDNAFTILDEGLSDRSVKLRTYKDVQSSLTGSVERMGRYLSILGVIALMMGRADFD